MTLGQAGMVQSGRTTAGRVDWVAGSAMLLRRTALDRVGLFDEGFFMYHEDTDICRRFHDAGLSVHYLPQATVIHDGWGSTSAVPFRRIDEAQRSRRRYWRKYHGAVGSRVSSLLDAYRYSVAAAVAYAASLLPESRRPSGAGEWSPTNFAYSARAALGLTAGIGLREAADDFNRELDSRAPVGASAVVPDAEVF